jgi:hypothetical protein
MEAPAAKTMLKMLQNRKLVSQNERKCDLTVF